MRSIYEPNEAKAMRQRIEALTESNTRQWGKMTVGQMVCHVSDPIREALGDRHSKSAVPFFFKPIAKKVILSEKPFKHGDPTLKAFRQGDGGGTKPTNFASDKATLLELYDRFIKLPANFNYPPHPGVGKMNRDEQGWLMLKHLDHHLSQFSA